ncbi:hypothetical protein GOODEAATRI_015470 [Goodea atripinnis]|uniref:Ig-like domain-containing protein n=1 Tax=Goodea atripinnis TaxID=208336 RepID=A0ABV0NWJ9_9TELE
MTLICILIWTLLCCCFTESRGQVTVTQPGKVTSDRDRSVSIKCTTSQHVYGTSYLYWTGEASTGEVRKGLTAGIARAKATYAQKILYHQRPLAHVEGHQKHHTLQHQGCPRDSSLSNVLNRFYAHFEDPDTLPSTRLTPPRGDMPLSVITASEKDPPGN